MTYDEQLDLWVQGQSVHDIENDWCCPDFSCCNKAIQTPMEDRQLFANAYRQGQISVTDRMLVAFLGNAMATLGKSVYIAGQAETERHAKLS